MVHFWRSYQKLTKQLSKENSKDSEGHVSLHSLHFYTFDLKKYSGGNAAWSSFGPILKACFCSHKRINVGALLQKKLSLGFKN